MIAEVTTPKVPRLAITSPQSKMKSNVKVKKVDKNATAGLVYTSRRLLASYIWDSSPASHTSIASSAESTATLSSESLLCNLTTNRTEFMYLYDTYLHDLEPLFPKFGIKDNTATKERIAIGLITTIDKAMLACAAAQLSITTRDNLAVNYRAICHSLIQQAKADMPNESKDRPSAQIQLFFLFGICYLLVPDIQPDDHYIGLFVEETSKTVQSDSNSIAAIGNEARVEECAVRNFWTMYLLHYCRYQNVNLKALRLPDDSATWKKIIADGRTDEQCLECYVFLGATSSLMQLRHSIQCQIDSETPPSLDNYERWKAALHDWRNTLPDTYHKVYQIMDDCLLQPEVKGIDIDRKFKFGDLSHYALLSRIIYTGTTLLLEEYLHPEMTKGLHGLALNLATSMVLSLEVAILHRDFYKSLYLMTQRLIMEDSLLTLNIILYAATSQLTSHVNLDDRLAKLIIRASKSIKGFLRQAAVRYKQENLSQLEADIQNRTLLGKINTLREQQNYGNENVILPIPAADLPTVGDKPAGIPAAPSSSVTIPLFSTYEILFGAESSSHTPSPRYDNP